MLKKIVIVAVIIVVLILAIAAAGVFWGLNKVNSPEFRQIILAKITESTGMHVEMENLHIGFFSTEITNLAVPSANGENFLQAKRIKVHYSLLKLKQKPIVIDKIEIDEPVVLARKDSTGTLILPFEKAPGVEKEPAEAGEPLTLSLPEIYVRNGNISLFAHDKSLLFAATGANLQASYVKLTDSQKANGNLKIGKITVAPGISVTDFSSPVTYENNKITLPQIQSTVYTGALSGDANVDLAAAPSTFATKINITKLDISGLMGDLGGDPTTLTGKLDLNFTGNGNLDEPMDLTAKGDLLIPSPTIGKLQSYRTLTQIIGTFGGVSLLKEGKFDDIKSNFNISGQKVQLEPLDVNSRNISIHLTGPISFDKILDLKGEVTLAPGILQVAQTVETIIGTVNAIKNPGEPEPAQQPKTPDKVVLPITITGSADDPKIGISGGNAAPPSPQTIQDKTQSIIKGINSLFNKSPDVEPAPETQP